MNKLNKFRQATFLIWRNWIIFQVSCLTISLLSVHFCLNPSANFDNIARIVKLPSSKLKFKWIGSIGWIGWWDKLYELGDISNFPHTKKIKNSMKIFLKSRNDKNETGRYLSEVLDKKGQPIVGWMGLHSKQRRRWASENEREVLNRKVFC